MKEPIFFNSLIGLLLLLPPVVKGDSSSSSSITALQKDQKLAIQRITASKKSRADDWIQAYKATKEQTDPLLQCAGFKKLMSDKKFPLRDFAHMRASLICKELEEEWNPENSWLRPRWSKLKTDALREQKPNSKELAKSLQDNLKYEGLLENRVRILEEAIRIAKALKDGDFLKELNQSLEKTAPRFKLKFSKEEHIQVAKDFQRARDFKKARKLYLEVLNGKGFSESDIVDAWKGLIRIEKVEQDKVGHIKMLERYVDYLKTTTFVKRYLDAEVDLIRAVWTMGQSQRALALLKKRLKTKIKGESFALQNWLVARIYEEKKDLEKGVFYLRKSLKEPIKDINFKDTVNWDLAWMLFKMKRHTEAQMQFQQIIDSTENEFHKARAMYWQAQSLKELNHLDSSSTVLRALIQLDPLGYYGMIAHRELGLPISRPESKTYSDETLLGKINANKVYSPEWVDWMLKMGESEVISDYLNFVSDSYRKEKEQKDEVWLSILKSYAKGGDYLKLFEKLYQIDPKVRAEILTDHPDLLFPMPYREQVEAGAKRFGVEPSLIYSITRQESAFNPEARSPADAIGLMQLLPSVAKRMGKAISIEVKDYRDLFDPEKNITIASYLLSQQMKRHKNDFITYVASYNASDKAIQNWKKTRPTNNPRQFIEDIPYEETRSYVRLIIRNYVFYKLLLSDKKELPFPEEVFTPDISSGSKSAN